MSFMEFYGVFGFQGMPAARRGLVEDESGVSLRESWALERFETSLITLRKENHVQLTPTGPLADFEAKV